jgi:hypothetical protein
LKATLSHSIPILFLLTCFACVEHFEQAEFSVISQALEEEIVISAPPFEIGTEADEGGSYHAIECQCL